MNPTHKHIIFANPVRDLSIARYLAAMEVDYLGIDLDQADAQKTKLLIHQLQEWIYGPKLIGVSATPPGDLCTQFPMDGYFIDADIPLADDVIVFRTKSFVAQHSECRADFIILQDLNYIGLFDNAILSTTINEDIQKHDALHGYMISPGSEEKTGLYDFEKLEEWFEKLGGGG